MSQSRVDAPKLGHPDTSTIFVLGLLGMIGALWFGACAWYFGGRLLRKYDAEPGRWGRRRWVEAGIVMGKLSIVVAPLEWILVSALT